ncbi:MAG: squalene synthase HpnC, partial [Bacteroidota bacterium]|jgi:squalene synthase HpnC
VYAFARHADDIADEGNASPEQRREALEHWRAQFATCMEQGSVNEDRADRDGAAGSKGNGQVHPVFIALGNTMRRFRIPEQLFHDLLDAFVQDTQKQQYDDFDELLGYCRRSADPVGRIILALFGCLDERTAPASDALCTGLQLVNFWQDVSIDRDKPRLYIPKEDLARFGLAPDDILHGEDTHATRTVIAFEVERTREFFYRALPLFPLVPRRLRLELGAIWRGGMRVLEKIEKQRYTVIQSRPSLSATDVLSIFSGAVLKGIPHAGS